MRNASVRNLLDHAADLAGEVPQPTSAQFQARRRSHRRRLAAMGGSVGVVAVVVGLTVGLTGAGKPSQPPANRSIAPAPVAVGALEHYRWRSLPAAPIAVRPGAAGVWTGRQLIVWGGGGDRRTFADGAAYDPATASWTALPSSPLSARYGALAAWTGRNMVVWGGVDAQGDHLQTGATYDPATRRWTAMPAAPVTVTNSLDLFRVGDRAFLVGLDMPFAATQMQAAAFDPATNRWQSLPSIAITGVNNYTGVSGSQLGTKPVVWISAHAAYALDPARARWAVVPYSPKVAGCIYQAIPTRNSVVYPPSFESISCGGDLAFSPGITHGAALDLRTGITRPMPVTPASDGQAFATWTGAALLEADAGQTYQTGNTRGPRAGLTTAWNPRTNTWVPLRTAPAQPAGQVVWVWTGTELLGWGPFAAIHKGEPPLTLLVFEPRSRR